MYQKTGSNTLKLCLEEIGLIDLVRRSYLYLFYSGCEGRKGGGVGRGGGFHNGSINFVKHCHTLDLESFYSN
jgi:hypothetical protein